MDVPHGTDGQPVLAEALWQPLDMAVQAVLAALAAQVVTRTARVRELEVRLGQPASNSSRPPSSDPPQVPHRSIVPPSGRARGANPGTWRTSVPSCHRSASTTLSTTGPPRARTAPRRERVAPVAAELGYQPNRLARGGSKFLNLPPFLASSC